MIFMRVVYVITLMLIAHTAYAACSVNRCTGKISFIYINESSIRVRMDQDMTALNCTLSEGKYATLRAGHPFREEIYKTLLAGHVAENPNMSIRISESTNGCRIQYITSSH